MSLLLVEFAEVVDDQWPITRVLHSCHFFPFLLRQGVFLSLLHVLEQVLICFRSAVAHSLAARD
jgi:hypothetical protein